MTLREGSVATPALSTELDLVPKEKEDTAAMENLYELRLYDTPLLEFKLEERGVSLTAKITTVPDEQQHLLPLDLQLTDEGVLSWLRHRVIPKNRAFVEEILKTLGLSVGNTKGITSVCCGITIPVRSSLRPPSSTTGFRCLTTQCGMIGNGWRPLKSTRSAVYGNFWDECVRRIPRLWTEKSEVDIGQ